MNRTLVNEDEPVHMERRRALMDAFTPQNLEEHQHFVRELVRKKVDGFIYKGRADLVQEMLWEIPLMVALHFLGVPEDDMQELRKFAVAHTVNTGKTNIRTAVGGCRGSRTILGILWPCAGENEK